MMSKIRQYSLSHRLVHRLALRGRLFLSGAIALGLLGGLNLLGLPQALDNVAYTLLFQLRGVRSWDDRVVVIGIDEPTVAAFSKLHWSRDLYSELLERLGTDPPRAIGFNVLLNQPTVEDARLARAIARQSAPVVLGVAWDSNGKLQAPPPALQQVAAHQGHISDFIEVQGIIQQVKDDSPQIPSLSQAIAHVLDLSPPIPSRSVWVNWSGPLHQITTYSFIEVLQGHVAPHQFRDKIVLVGLVAPGFDTVYTPFDREQPASTVYVHAAVLSNLLGQQPLTPVLFRPSLPQNGLYLSLALGLSVLLADRRGRTQLLLGLGASGLWLSLGLGAIHHDYLLATASPVLLLALTTATSLLYWKTQDRDRLAHAVERDTVTHLPNRAAFVAQLSQQVQCAPTGDWSIILINLDRFRAITMHQGYGVGNQVLQEVAQRLRSFSQHQPEIRSIGHLGHDEFVLLVAPLSTADRNSLLVALTQVLQASYRLPSNQVLFWQVSLGVALVAESGTDPQVLLHHANGALRQARLQHETNCAVFNAQLHHGAIALWQLELDLHQTVHALAAKKNTALQETGTFGFYLDYQPIIHLPTQAIAGFEALVRWQHPQRGILSPTEFIPLAESTGLIHLLGQWVLHRACYQLQAWRMAFPQYPDLMMTVNLSPIQLLDVEVLEQVQAVLIATGLASQHLKLEITESHLMKNGEVALQLLNELRNLGICLSLDDFGVGYSSLSRLQQLPIDTIKIDRAFVDQLSIEQLNPSATGQTIIHLILEFAHQLALQVVAEGIETPAQLQTLQTMGVDYGQGYWLSPPLTAQAVGDFLQQ
ncbi:MAG: EAL domain-containing protein [Cyanobacteria bacterium P01_G01_bin.54]